MDFPLINGRRYSFASVILKINGRQVVGVKEVSYNWKIDRAKVRGTNIQPLGMTRGEYDCEGSLTFYKEDYDELIANLGDGYGEAVFDIAVSYADVGQPTVTDELRGCSLGGAEKSPSQGTDALEVKCDLSITYILENGRKALRGMRV